MVCWNPIIITRPKTIERHRKLIYSSAMTTMETTNIQADFRIYLQQVLLERLKKNQRYSIRAFAKALQIPHTALAEIINGKRPLSAKMQKRISMALGLSPSEMEQYQTPHTQKNLQKKRTDTNKLNKSILKCSRKLVEKKLGGTVGVEKSILFLSQLKKNQHNINMLQKIARDCKLNQKTLKKQKKTSRQEQLSVINSADAATNVAEIIEGFIQPQTTCSAYGLNGDFVGCEAKIRAKLIPMGTSWKKLTAKLLN